MAVAAADASRMETAATAPTWVIVTEETPCSSQELTASNGDVDVQHQQVQRNFGALRLQDT